MPRDATDFRDALHRTTPMTLCETFRRQAFWTWEQLARARALRVHLGEESLTDFNLLEIRSRHSDEVVTKTFTKAQEGILGADWE